MEGYNKGWMSSDKDDENFLTNLIAIPLRTILTDVFVFQTRRNFYNFH